ncbi:ABC transporter permease subunit [Streptomyces mangrovisoli]|uniref:ABC transporter permease n=1 Tax=Streptomyces mangrovisoli TaxID=1428628 RepID=A0A1J4P051_9ACTN|nr:ABC transporter permease subunit [Streptomyces mangrovisoli]OIJ67995.1 hypothetical protein WN71_010655 [Streptomyces mangrovisoli]
MTATSTPPATPAGPPAPHRSRLHPARAGFLHLLRAEWTKFRTVRAWPLVLLAAAVVTVLISMLSASGSHTSGSPPFVQGPDGTVVSDSFRTTHRSLTGDGTLTVRVTSMRADGGGLEPWAKAGLLIKQSLKRGAPYAAVMVTPGHGVRAEWNFTHDTAGPAADPTASPQWLRLTRKGDTVTAYASADGRGWTRIAAVRLSGLARTVQAGVFVATPDHEEVSRSIGGGSVTSGGGSVTAAFDHLSLRGTSPDADWASTDVGAPAPDGPTPHNAPGEGRTQVSAAGTYTLTGHGDIAPDTLQPDRVQMSFQGVSVGLLFLVAVGVLFMTSEYKRGLIRTTFTASPSRAAVLGAKSLVIGGVTVVTCLPALALGYVLAQRGLRRNGYAEPAFPDLPLLHGPAARAVVGSALLMALVAVLALAVGAVLRSTAGAIATVTVLVVLPQILSLALPLGLARWLLRVTPAAAFAVQQGVPHYGFGRQTCLPESGCYPLDPWPGLLVLVAYTAAALGLAVWTVRRRDA